LRGSSRVLGYCASHSHSRYFWGLRLYFLCAPDGMPIYFALAPAKDGEREVAAAMLERARDVGLLTGGELIVADKGFSGEFENPSPRSTPRSSVPTARARSRGSASLAASVNGSNRSTTPPRTSSRSRVTAAAFRRAFGSASASASSRWPLAYGTAGRSGRQESSTRPAATSSTTTTNPISGLSI